jgi:hypothetical protein
VRNGGFEFSLRNIFIHARKVLLHADFTSPPKEVVLRIHRPRWGSNPRTLGPVASTLTTSPPRSTFSDSDLQKLYVVKVNWMH